MREGTHEDTDYANRSHRGSGDQAVSHRFPPHQANQIKSFFTLHSEDAVYGVKCPHVGCDHLMDYYEISQCADPDLVKKFETFTLNRALAKLDQLVYVYLFI